MMPRITTTITLPSQMYCAGLIGPEAAGQAGDDREHAADPRALRDAPCHPHSTDGSSSGEIWEDFATSRKLLATAVSSHNTDARMMEGDDW